MTGGRRRMSEDTKTEPSGVAPGDWAADDLHIHKPKA